MPAFTRIAASLLALGLATAPARATEAPADPLRSVMWKEMVARFLNDGRPVAFDPLVRVFAPKRAENAMEVPVTVDATGVENVEQIVVFADIAPIPHILTYRPENAAAYLSFRFKVEQPTPVRAAVLAGGTWHIGFAPVDASGGGCTSPSSGRAASDWSDHLNEVQARVWPQAGEEKRLRLRIRHPMDTGLASGIPAFFIEKLYIETRDGTALGTLELHEPVSENPVVTLRPRLAPSATEIRIRGRDTGGGEINVTVPVPQQSSGLDQAKG